MDTKPCPICSKPLLFNPRYPNAVCRACEARATDGHGRFLKFYNRHIFGGFVAYYADADGKEEYKSNICYINQQKCIAAEARFGGIVVQVVKPRERQENDSEKNKDEE